MAGVGSEMKEFSAAATPPTAVEAKRSSTVAFSERPNLSMLWGSAGVERAQLLYRLHRAASPLKMAIARVLKKKEIDQIEDVLDHRGTMLKTE